MIQVTMFLKKETKNCYRYEAPEDLNPNTLPPPVDCIYLQKRVLNGAAAPKSVVVQVVLPA